MEFESQFKRNFLSAFIYVEFWYKARNAAVFGCGTGYTNIFLASNWKFVVFW